MIQQTEAGTEIIFRGYCPKEQKSCIYNRDMLQKRKSKYLRPHMKLNKMLLFFQCS